MDPRRQLRWGVVVCALLALAACSGTGEGATPPTTPVEAPLDEMTPRAEPTLRLPLTGRPVDEVPDGPVIAVKVDNTRPAFPQSGIGQADLVVEEPVEGGVTRLVVMLHSRASEARTPVGPVRSIRSSDIGIVAPAEAVVYASGGAPIPQADLAAAGIETRFESAPGFVRDASRGFLHGRFLDVPTAVASLSAVDPPPAYFAWSPERRPRLPQSRPLSAFDLVFSPFQTTSMVPSSRGWTRSLAEPDGFVATTVIALRVNQVLAGYVDPGGYDVPIAVTEGRGTGWVAHRGRVTDVVWTKRAPDQGWRFATADGREVRVPPGRVYLALLPSTTGSLVPAVARS